MSDDQYFIGKVYDQMVSFNYRRVEEDYRNNYNRQVVVRLPELYRQPIMIPGIDDHSEKKLLQKVTSVHNRKESEKTSFKLNDHYHSLLWRFSLEPRVISKMNLSTKSFSPLLGKQRKQVRKKVDVHNRRLEESLRPGQVFLIPDREVDFDNQNRWRQPYSRKVLIFSCDENQVTIMPFTSKVRNVEPTRDILFDSQSSTENLDYEAEPAVITFPFNMFRIPVLLKVGMAQPMPRQKLIETGLLPLGMVTRNVVELARQRLTR
jgi:hypothetical protein